MQDHESLHSLLSYLKKNMMSIIHMKLVYNHMLMLLQKWNPEKHIYELFNSPAKKLMLISRDMDERCDCANC